MTETTDELSRLIELLRAERSSRDIHPAILSAIIHLTAYRDRLLEAETLAEALERHVGDPMAGVLALGLLPVALPRRDSILDAVLAHLRGHVPDEGP